MSKQKHGITQYTYGCNLAGSPVSLNGVSRTRPRGRRRFRGVTTGING